MKFKGYLTEKVRKSELEDIFSDNSILIGSEFEFFVDELSEMAGIGNREELSTMGRDFKMDLYAWRKRVEVEQSELSNEISELKEKRDSFQEDIDNYKETVKEIKRELKDKNISKEYRENRRKRLESEKDRIKSRGKRIRDIESRISEMEDEIIKIFDRFEIPKAPVELRDFISEVTADLGEEFDINDIDPIKYLDNPDRFERYFDSVESSEAMFEIDEDELLDKAYTIFNSTFDFNFEIRTSPGKGDDFWGITIDTSVPPEEGGIELISPPLPMPEFLDKAEKVLNFIGNSGSTDNRCGFHVHISIEGVNLQEELDVVKLFLFHDEEKVYQAFKEREGSKHAYSVKQKIEDARFELDDLRKLIDVDKLEQKLSTSKFYGINLSYLEKNHIEFRYMGGANYEDKGDAIKENAGNYAYNLKLACDSQFKRQEYIKKLSRAINRFMEKGKPYYLRAAIYTFLKFEIIDKYNSIDTGVAELLNVINRELQDTLNDTNNNLRTAFKNFKSVSYSSNEVAGISGKILKEIEKQSGIHVKNDEVYDYLKDTLLNPKNLIRKLRNKFKYIIKSL